MKYFLLHKKIISFFTLFVLFIGCNTNSNPDSISIDSLQDSHIIIKDIKPINPTISKPLDSIKIRRKMLFEWIIDSLLIELKSLSIQDRSSATGISKKNKYLYRADYKGHYGEYYLGNSKKDLGYLIVYYPDTIWNFNNNNEILIYYSTIGIKQQLFFFNIGSNMSLTTLKKTIGEPDYTLNGINSRKSKFLKF